MQVLDSLTHRSDVVTANEFSMWVPSHLSGNKKMEGVAGQKGAGLNIQLSLGCVYSLKGHVYVTKLLSKMSGSDKHAAIMNKWSTPLGWTYLWWPERALKLHLCFVGVRSCHKSSCREKPRLLWLHWVLSINITGRNHSEIQGVQKCVKQTNRPPAKRCYD